MAWEEAPVVNLVHTRMFLKLNNNSVKVIRMLRSVRVATQCFLPTRVLNIVSKQMPCNFRNVCNPTFCQEGLG